MITRPSTIHVHNLKVEVIKKDIKHIHLGVYPPNGRIRVAAPLKTKNEVIRLLLISRIPWIKKQQSKFLNQERQTKREYISGESHYFFGKRYLLNVIHTDSSQRIDIKRNSYINLYVKEEASLLRKEQALNDFYRSELRKQIPALFEKWGKITGIKIDEIKIKKMKTKWGTCNHKDRRIWLNLELAKKPLHCIEYVLLHEMIHFIEKNHTKEFVRLMNSFLPQWQQYKEELNTSILGYSVWTKTK